MKSGTNKKKLKQKTKRFIASGHFLWDLKHTISVKHDLNQAKCGKWKRDGVVSYLRPRTACFQVTPKPKVGTSNE